MKLVFVFTTRVLETYPEEFGINFLQQRGYDIDVLDLSPIIYPEAYARIKTGYMRGENIIVIRKKREFVQYIRKIGEGNIFIFVASYNLETNFFFRTIKKEIYGFLWCSASIVLDGSEGKISMRELFKRRLNSVFVRLPHFLKGIYPARFIISSLEGEGNALRERRQYKSDDVIIKHVASKDFVRCLEVKEKQELLVHETYCVFIDDFMCFHPDNYDCGITYGEDEISLYYKELRDYFYYIEKTMNVKVIIALHPRADYSMHTECYEGFTAIRFKTPELIMNSRFVLTHMSEAILYAMFFNKPVFFLNCTLLNKKEIFYKQMISYIELFHLVSIDISSEEEYRKVNISKLLDVDEKFYIECVRKYYYCNYRKGIVEKYSLYENLLDTINEIVNKD